MASRRSRAASKASFPTTSESPDAEFWTAYARGANFEELERRGFTTFYPVVDDYAFLRACDENRHLLGRAEEVGVEFLQEADGRLSVVRWEDLAGLASHTVKSIGPGDPVEIVRGTAEGMTGRVLALTPEGIRVKVESYRRTYEVTVSGLDLVLIKP